MPDFRGISRESFDFMRELEGNNNRIWFEANRERWEALREELRAACVALAPFVHELDPELETEPKTGRSLGRINRDTRFSKDKKPYKDHIDILFFPRNHSRTTAPGFAFGLTTGQSYIGTWLGASMPDWRNRLEANIAAHPRIFEKYLGKNSNFSRMWMYEESYKKTRVAGLPPLCQLWAQRKFYYMAEMVEAAEVVKAGRDIVKTIEATFLRLYPLFIFATSLSPAADLEKFRRKFSEAGV
ncbi:MAG TPA: DUF2461 domain-containing protein [Candidatus Glassbacteria bacterium]|nr:DUF2461 domain-containing protein [Candidatus Glassbacteria bacterium]